MENKRKHITKNQEHQKTQELGMLVTKGEEKAGDIWNWRHYKKYVTEETGNGEHWGPGKQ